MDCDPRDYDSRQDERFDPKGKRTSRGGSYDRDLDDWRQPEMPARELGRGPGDDSRQSNSDAQRHDPRDATRRPTRDRDPRDAFTRDLHLPRGREREIVRDRDREFTLRGSESRTLATVGAFRVVSSRDLRDHHDRPADPRSGDLATTATRIMSGAFASTHGSGVRYFCRLPGVWCMRAGPRERRRREDHGVRLRAALNLDPCRRVARVGSGCLRDRTAWRSVRSGRPQSPVRP
jgi:hypothetical protein